MRPVPVGAIGLIGLALMMPGCATPIAARYVYQDGDYGVVGIPVNSPWGKLNYQVQAHELMTRHFPEGYEIVRAEEIVEGQRTLDIGKKSEYETEPTLTALNQMIKLGKFGRSTSSEQKDNIPIVESRIIYRRRPKGATTSNGGFATLPSSTPPLYIDPNETMREMVACRLSEAKKLASKAPGDPETRKALLEIFKPPDPAAAASKPDEKK